MLQGIYNSRVKQLITSKRTGMQAVEKRSKLRRKLYLQQ